MRRALLILGILALVSSALVTALRLVLPGSSVVEVFPVEPDALQLPAAIGRPVSAPSPAPATQAFPRLVTLQQGVDGYEGCTDTFFEYYRLSDNFCRDPELYLRAGNKASVLLRYDLSTLPKQAIGLDSDATIQKATLSVFVVQGRKDTVIGLYRVRRPWDACSVTWNLPWSKPGADGAEDRELEPSSVLTTVKAAGWLEWDVTELVRDWLRDPNSNQGLMLKSFELRWPSHLILFSADHPALGTRPKLTIKYEASVRTPTPVLPTLTATTFPEPEATPTLSAEPSASPTTPPTPIPTPTATPVLGSRVIELRWRQRMNAGNSYNITAVFRPPSAQGQTTGVALPYELSVGGHLTAPSFDAVQLSEAQQVLRDANASLSWSWTVTPRLVGSLPLSLDLVFEWRLADVADAEPGIWYKTKIVQVDQPMATWAQLDMARNGMALIGLACLVAWYLLRKRV